MTRRQGVSAGALSVLVAGGILEWASIVVGQRPAGAPVATAVAEVWNLDALTVVPVLAPAGWAPHTATLQADGTVLMATAGDGRTPIRNARFDPRGSTITTLEVPPTDDVSTLRVAEAQPPHGATDVPLEPLLTLRLSHPADPDSLAESTVVLAG